MDDQLQATLLRQLQERSGSNPALSSLLSDYTRFHLVLVVLGGAFLLCFLLLSVFSWRWYRRSPRTGGPRWTFERKTCLLLLASSAVLALMLSVVVAANLSNVLNPRDGFSGSVEMIGVAQPGTPTAILHQAFTTWLQSGDVQTPSLVQRRIDDRLAWQPPKAIISGVLFILFVALGAHIWRTLVGKARVRRATWSLRDRALLGAGIGTGLACLVLMLMVLGNTQASISPLSMTLVFG